MNRGSALYTYFQIFTVSSEAGSLFFQSFAHHSGDMWTCSRIYLLLITNYYYFALVLRIRKSGRLNKAEKKGSKNCQKKHNARSHPVTRYPIRLVACHASKRGVFFSSVVALHDLHVFPSVIRNNMHCASFWSLYLGWKDEKKRHLNDANAILLESFIHPSPSRISCDAPMYPSIASQLCSLLPFVYRCRHQLNAVTLIQTLGRPSKTC